MKNVAKDIGIENPSDEEVNKLLVDLDRNKDGKISLDEFEVLIR